MGERLKSLAIWYSGRKLDPLEIDIHFNIWKLPTANNSFDRFLDIGLNLNDATYIDKIFLYLPFKIGIKDISDLGEIIVKGSPSLLAAIFNENYRISSETTSNYHQVSDENSNEVFNIYKLNKKSFSITEKHGGSVVEIKLPDAKIIRDKTYLRIRIAGTELLNFSKIEKNVSSIFNNAFTKIELFDFRINSKRHLPVELLEEISQRRSFSIAKVHFFYICSYRENYILSHRPVVGARNLEEDIWDEYITHHNQGKKNDDTLIAYHWKEKTNLVEYIEDFGVFTKTSFYHCNWRTIASYLGFLAVFSVLIGVVSNFLFIRYFQ